MDNLKNKPEYDGNTINQIENKAVQQINQRATITKMMLQRLNVTKKL